MQATLAAVGLVSSIAANRIPTVAISLRALTLLSERS
jgi:hypothetical protein